MALCGKPPHTAAHRGPVRVMNKDSTLLFHVGVERLLKYPNTRAATCFKLKSKENRFDLSLGKQNDSGFLPQLFLTLPWMLFSLLSPGVWLWRHPLSAEWVGEHHHCAAAPCAGERGSSQVQLIHCSLLRQLSFTALPHCDIYSCSQKELSYSTRKYFSGLV